MGMADRVKKLRRARPAKVWKREPEVLLCGNVPKPMHGLAPRVVLGRKWWDQTRQAAYASTNNHCIACGVHKFRAMCRQWMEGHELYAVDYVNGRMKYLRTVPLCHYCHNYIHSGRLEAMLEKGEITHAKYAAIHQHGDAVLDDAGLEKEEHQGLVAPWEKWRLVIGRKTYKPKFKTYEDWVAFYGKET